MRSKMSFLERTILPHPLKLRTDVCVFNRLRRPIFQFLGPLTHDLYIGLGIRPFKPFQHARYRSQIKAKCRIDNRDRVRMGLCVGMRYDSDAEAFLNPFTSRTVPVWREVGLWGDLTNELAYRRYYKLQ